MTDDLLNDAEIADRAADGAVFMDATDPEWFWVVDPDRLDMAEPVFPRRGCGCVMAQHSPRQTYFYYDYGLSELEAEALGFVVSDYRYLIESVAIYAALTAAWRDEINDRRWAALGKRAEAA